MTYQARSTPKIIGILTKVYCTSGLNLVILAWTGDVLSHVQVQNGVNFDFKVKFDLEGQGQSPPKNNKDLNQGLLQLWSKFGDPSLNGWCVIAWTSKWLPHTRTDEQTHTQTDAANENTQRPKLASGTKLTRISASLSPASAGNQARLSWHHHNYISWKVTPYDWICRQQLSDIRLKVLLPYLGNEYI